MNSSVIVIDQKNPTHKDSALLLCNSDFVSHVIVVAQAGLDLFRRRILLKTMALSLVSPRLSATTSRLIFQACLSHRYLATQLLEEAATYHLGRIQPLSRIPFCSSRSDSDEPALLQTFSAVVKTWENNVSGVLSPSVSTRSSSAIAPLA